MLTNVNSPFGTLPTGEIISQYTLTNSHGMQAKLINYGATLTSLQIPIANRQLKNIVLGFDNLASYVADDYFIGCTIGRVAGRICRGKFSYQNKFYQLALNDNNRHHLHGGRQGFHKVVWQANPLQNENAVGIEFFYLSPDGEGSYPGNLHVKVTYWLTDDNELKIHYYAETDQSTPVNLTNHTYWNLNGSGTVLQHELQLFADHYLMTDDDLIPTGKIKAVQNPQIIQELKGYDAYYVFPTQQNNMHLAARVKTKEMQLEICTSQPGVQFYTGNNLPEKWTGFCLETQGFPDAINHDHFPNIILHPGEIYQHETIYVLRRCGEIH